MNSDGYQWLEELKVGDEVILECRGWGNVNTIELVEKITDRQIILSKDRRYWKKNGKSLESGYIRPSLLECTPQRKLETLKVIRRNHLINKFQTMNWKELSGETLIALNKALAEAQQATQRDEKQLDEHGPGIEF